MKVIQRKELRMRLERFLSSANWLGLRSSRQRGNFVNELWKAQVKLRAISRKQFKGRTDPQSAEFHPLKALLEEFRAGRCDEAVWLSFLCIHFGWSNTAQRSRDAVRLFYGKLGGGKWEWKTVAAHPSAIRDWMKKANPAGIRRLRFGNHRKFETNNPDSPNGTAAIICSFVDWVRASGTDGPFEALRSVPRSSDPKEGFDRLFQGFEIIRFGRTGKFDFLCLLGNLGLLPISPGHCYLHGSTGPKTGALLMVTGKKEGRVTQRVAEEMERLQRALDVPVEALEDALCNWQKEKGFLSVTCG